jgi:hypothetical protein
MAARARVYAPKRATNEWQSYSVEDDEEHRWVCEWLLRPAYGAGNTTIRNYDKQAHLDTGNVVLALI